MAACKVCGEWAGIMQSSHEACLRPKPVVPADTSSVLPAQNAAPLRMGTIVGGVFWGMWLFYISAAIVTAIIWAGMHS